MGWEGRYYWGLSLSSCQRRQLQSVERVQEAETLSLYQFYLVFDVLYGLHGVIVRYLVHVDMGICRLDPFG